MNRTEKMLLVIRDEVFPFTRKEVARGNHVFGGAILRADTLETVVVGSNNRIESPLFHGEVDTLNRFFKLPSRPASSELLFIATHDPCPMCAASIAWAGFREVWTLFDYEDVEKSFDMPVDLLMYREVFGVDGVRPINTFFNKKSLNSAAVAVSESVRLLALIDEIDTLYSTLQVSDFDNPGM